MDQIVQQHSYFKREEFACGCGCGFDELDPGLWDILNVTRERTGRVMFINSGCRCSAHNLAVGGSPTSSHLYGLAVDIRCDNDEHRWQLILVLMSLGVTRIGIAKGFIHIDIDRKKTPFRIWVYKT